MAAKKKSHSLTPEKEAALKAFADYGTVAAAMRKVGMARRTWYDWKENDAEFAKLAGDAELAVADDLEEEAIKRAKESSDTLLIFLLKGHKPERYREKLDVKADLTQTMYVVEVPPKLSADAWRSRYSRSA